MENIVESLTLFILGVSENPGGAMGRGRGGEGLILRSLTFTEVV